MDYSPDQDLHRISNLSIQIYPTWLASAALDGFVFQGRNYWPNTVFFHQKDSTYCHWEELEMSRSWIFKEKKEDKNNWITCTVRVICNPFLIRRILKPCQIKGAEWPTILIFLRQKSFFIKVDVNTQFSKVKHLDFSWLNYSLNPKISLKT